MGRKRDIVNRLRDVTEMNWEGDEVTEPLCEEAAAEIEQLRAALRLAAEDALVEIADPAHTSVDDVIRNYLEEARRD